MKVRAGAGSGLPCCTVQAAAGRSAVGVANYYKWAARPCSNTEAGRSFARPSVTRACNCGRAGEAGA